MKKHQDAPLSQEQLQRVLARPLRYYDSVDSSNDIAKEWLMAGAPAGALVIADEQRRGRGRKQRSWHTPPGAAIALSMILRPPPAQLPQVNMLGALAVLDLAREIGCKDVSIKWPNDVQIQGKKVCGILVENSWQDGYLQGSVLGIGINVRVDFRGQPWQADAISLELACQGSLSRVELLRRLLLHLDRWRAQAGQDALLLAWKRELNTIGKWVAGSTFQGLAVDVSGDGALCLRDDTGALHTLHADQDFVIQDRRGSA